MIIILVVLLDHIGSDNMTKAQNLILHVLREQRHLTAESVYAEAKKEMPNIALGTVYRNLSQFSENDVVLRIPRSNAADFFDGNPTPHNHIFCIQCGDVEDIFLPDLEQFVSDHIQADILSVELSVNYVCPKCAEK